MKLTNGIKILLTVLFIGASVVGFMVKLPSAFRHSDKGMHTLYYFLAAAFLNFLFAGKNIIRHGVIFIALYVFGVAIEYAQEYSNTFFRKKIHGRYDVEDIDANLKGLIYFSAVWVAIVGLWFIVNKFRVAKANDTGL